MADFVTVDVQDNPIDAHIVKGLLESEGIPVFVAHENHIYADWPISQALGGVKLQVKASNVEAANEVLAVWRAGGYAHLLDEPEEKEQKPACPKCSSPDIKNKLPLALLLFTIFTLGLSGIIVPIRRSVHVCKSCGYKWKD